MELISVEENSFSHDFRKRKWLRHHAMVKAFCYAKQSATAPFSSGCILAWSIVSRILSRWNELFIPLFKQVEILISTYLSIIFPSVEIIVTCHGIIFPLSISAFFTAFSRPPQQGTSIRTISTLLMSLFLIISVSFSE